eukprot:CAMPEP_0115533966 /NCGR_PEP_ID=MMETSP0271-20121206/86412_1 /TAXON_ID=71861 /ORGANISM="Scrippsiella trochoidea, Strain CCMP3099" /LENGTH=178 /DNA_ID=CAMNT_0002966401 /DNA_START=1 /DNA_END=537 /DNA_ORIENTATION=-
MAHAMSGISAPARGQQRCRARRVAFLIAVALTIISPATVSVAAFITGCGSVPSRIVSWQLQLHPRTQRARLIRRRFFPNPPSDDDPNEAWRKDPMDPRWKGRQFDSAFTETAEDIKLSDLPRPGFLPPEFWDAFYEKGYFLVLAQAVIGGVVFFAIFNYLPFVLNGAILAFIGKPGGP